VDIRFKDGKRVLAYGATAVTKLCVLLNRSMNYKSRPVIIAASVLLPIGVALLCGLLGSIPSNSIRPPRGWVKIDARYFDFYVPPDLRSTPVTSIDSFVGRYKGNSFSISFDYGAYSDPLDGSGGGSTYHLHFEHIDGKRARVGFLEYTNSGLVDYAVGVNFREQGLTMTANCKSRAGCETARIIFRTVKFKRPGIRYYFRYLMQWVGIHPRAIP